MKSIVIYDSYFGNTQKIAEAIGAELECDVIKYDEYKSLEGIELLVLGSPTRAFSPSENIKLLLKSLSNLKGIKIAAFDTRMDVEKAPSKILKFLASKFGYAAEKIEKQLIKKGAQSIVEPHGFYVKDTEGPLEENEINLVKEWVGQFK